MTDSAQSPTLPGGTEAESSRILRARARALAMEPPPEDEPSEMLLVVQFLLAREEYAVEVEHVREVCPLRDLTPVPGTPPFIAGWLNVRGQILTAIDLKLFFGMRRPGLTELNHVVVVGNGSMELGILADAITGMHSIARSGIHPPPPTLSGILGKYLRGVTPQAVIILNIKALLSDESILVNDGDAP